MKLFSIFATAVLLSCSGTNGPTKEEIISSLEAVIDSTAQRNPEDGKIFVDSLLNIDPNNHNAISSKAFILFNNREMEEALNYMIKAGTTEENNPVYKIMSGLALEYLGSTDSATYFYEKTLPLLNDSTRNYTVWTPQLLTVLRTPKEGLESLEGFKDMLHPNFYNNTNNAILNYSGTGLDEFVGLQNRNIPYIEYQLTLPDSLYKNSELNSMEKVELFYSTRGVNVDIRRSHWSIEFGTEYTIAVLPKYRERLEQLDTLGIKKL